MSTKFRFSLNTPGGEIAGYAFEVPEDEEPNLSAALVIWLEDEQIVLAPGDTLKIDEVLE